MVSPLRTNVSWDGVVATVTATGELDIGAACALCDRLLKLAAAHPERLVLDLGGLVFGDAAGARALANVHRLLEAGCPVIVRRPPPWPHEVAGRAGIAGAWSVPAPGGDLPDRLNAARMRAAASFARTRDLWRRTECMLTENRMLREEIHETCRGGEGPAGRELLRRSAYARLVARLETMPVIEQAKGIIMAQAACDDAEAFDTLRRASQRSNVPVRELAAQLVAKSTGGTASAAAKPQEPAAR